MASAPWSLKTLQRLLSLGWLNFSNFSSIDLLHSHSSTKLTLQNLYQSLPTAPPEQRSWSRYTCAYVYTFMYANEYARVHACVHVCICACVGIHIYTALSTPGICVHIHVYTWACMCLIAHIYKYANMYINWCHMQVSTCTYVYVWGYVYICRCLYTCMYACVSRGTYVDVNAHVYLFVQINIHAYVRNMSSR